MKLAVIVPTWKRVRKLDSALKSLEAQILPPDLVIVTYRPEDKETAAYLSDWSQSTKLNLKLLELNQPGVIYAENQAIQILKDTDFEIVCFMDDDAIAFPDWVLKIKKFYSDHPEAAGLGGPDFIVAQPWTYNDIFAKTVGKLTFFGKVIGNHHHRSSGVRQVDVLKGVNMSIRRQFLTSIDSRLQGEDPAKGNGVFWELDLCLKIKTAGGKLYFDPDLLIKHDSDHAHFIPDHVMTSTSHNMTLVLMNHLSWPKKIIFLTYVVFIGNNNIKGLVKTLVELLKKRNLGPIRDFRYSMWGFFQGLKTWQG